jgi:hypothetical protein
VEDKWQEKKHMEKQKEESEPLGFWILSIIGILNTRKHNFSKTGSLSILQ